MGMLVTSFLVATSIYGSVEGPVTRGFSFIEEWYCGVQAPILLALMEYGLILGFIKWGKFNMNQNIFGIAIEELIRIFKYFFFL